MICYYFYQVKMSTCTRRFARSLLLSPSVRPIPFRHITCVTTSSTWSWVHHINFCVAPSASIITATISYYYQVHISTCARHLRLISRRLWLNWFHFVLAPTCIPCHWSWVWYFAVCLLFWHNSAFHLLSGYSVFPARPLRHFMDFNPLSLHFVLAPIYSVSPKLSIILLSLPITLAQLCSLSIIRTFCTFLHGIYATWWLSRSPHEPITSSAHHFTWLFISLYLWTILRSSDPSKSYVPALDFIIYTSGTSTSAKSCTSLSLPLYVRRPSLIRMLSSFAVVRGSRSNISTYMLR